MTASLSVLRPAWRDFSAVRSALARMLGSFRDRQQRARELRAFQALDARTLRDLGMDRSEIISFELEAREAVLRTRMRVAAPTLGL